MHSLYFTFSLLVLSSQLFAQDIPTKDKIVDHFGFEQGTIQDGGEDVVFYTYGKGDAPKSKLIVFLQGSDPSPQFGYYTKDGQSNPVFWHWGEYKMLSEEYLYVVIEKTGFEGVYHVDSVEVPEIYTQKNSLQQRVRRADVVIDHLVANHTFEKVIVYGHSEGAPVAAKLGTVNTSITHLGYWCGNALPDFYDFILENRIQYHKGEISAQKAQDQIDELIAQFGKIAQNPNDVEDGGYTNLRWYSYSEPPINHLLKIDIPIFVQVATEDQSAPIESTYLIPLEFARLGKTNLIYRVCVGCDHGFFVTDADGKKEHKWMEVFQGFIEWSENVDH